MSIKRNDVCYICGEENPNSKDHIPPKNIFLKKYRNLDSGLITVPSHSLCNKSYELDDEYFRYCLCIAAYWTNEKARELWKTKMKNQLHRSESAGYLKYLRELLKDGNFIDQNGIPHKNATVALLDSKRIERVIYRIVRGLFYKNFSYRLPDFHKLELNWLPPKGAKEIIGDLNIQNKFSSVAGGIFRHCYYFKSNNEKDGFYFLVFFDSVFFSVQVGDIL